MSQGTQINQNGLEGKAAPMTFWLEVGRIVESPLQPRMAIEEPQLLELAESLKHQGQIDPAIVRAIGEGRYEVISGHRRLLAAKLAGIEALLVREVDSEDFEALAIAIATNDQRENLSDYERAKSYRHMLELGRANGKLASQTDLAKLLGISPSAVSDRLKMLTLPQPAIDVLERYPAAFSKRAINDVMRAWHLASEAGEEELFGATLMRVAVDRLPINTFVSIIVQATKRPATDPEATSTTTSTTSVLRAGKVVAEVRLDESAKTVVIHAKEKSASDLASIYHRIRELLEGAD
jgi:ParB/RepB/Spo0J family partition protein